MKKIIWKNLLFGGMIISMAACGNSGNNSDSGDTTSAPVTPGVENVNGNVPDTSNSISLSSSDTTRTIKTDSLPNR